MTECLRAKLSVYVFGDEHGDEILAAEIVVIDSEHPEDFTVGFAAGTMWARALQKAREKLAEEDNDD